MNSIYIVFENKTQILLVYILINYYLSILKWLRKAAILFRKAGEMKSFHLFDERAIMMNIEGFR